MIQSASILPLIEELSWGRAVAPGALLTSVNASAPVDVESYRWRDQELAYRDLIVGALLTQVVIRVGDVWQFKARRPQLPATVSGGLTYSASDATLGVSSPGSVSHVTNSSTPIAAASTDQQLYARDMVLHEALRRAANILADNPVVSVGPSFTPGDAWSLAEGTRRALACAGFALPLDVALFKDADADLADRDNQLAVFVAQLQQALSDIFSRATRLLVKPPGQEPEAYVLTEDTDDHRVWSAFPLLPDGRLQVRYNKTQKTVSWLGEQPVAANPAPQALTVPVAGGDMNVLGAPPRAGDAEFFRQKAARLHTRPYTDRIIFQTSAPELYLTGGGIYQPSAVLLPITGQLLFSLPIVIPSGCARIGLQVMPSKFISILGFLNRTRIADGTAVTLGARESVTYDVPLPIGRILMQMEITDKTSRTPAFDLEITADGSLIFDGAFTFNKAPGEAVSTQAFELDNSDADTPGSVVITITRLDGDGELTINSLTFTVPAPDPDLTYALALKVGPNQPTYPLQLKGVAERQDVAWFDTLIPSALANPVLGVSYTGGNKAALYLNSYDIRVFDVRAALPDAAAYEPHKVTLAARALESAQRSWNSALATSPADPSTISDNGERTWDSAANSKWLSIIEAVQPRLLDAFDVAGPGDIGRPALIPDGLFLVEGTKTVLATLPKSRLRPVYRTLQAWMLEFNPRVAGPDFWPQSDAGCASSGDLAAITVTADFDWALTLPSTGAGYVTLMRAVSQLPGSPAGISFSAYTITNAGPAGGTVQQIVTLTIGLANLTVGASYNLTLSLVREPVGGGVETPYVTVIPITATAESMTVTLPPLVAPDGYEARVQSAMLA